MTWVGKQVYRKSKGKRDVALIQAQALFSFAANYLTSQIPRSVFMPNTNNPYMEQLMTKLCQSV